MKFPWTLFALTFVPMMSLVAHDEDAPEAPAVGEASLEEREPEATEPGCDAGAEPACARESVPADADPAMVAYGSSS